MFAFLFSDYRMDKEFSTKWELRPKVDFSKRLCSYLRLSSHGNQWQWYTWPTYVLYVHKHEPAVCKCQPVRRGTLTSLLESEQIDEWMFEAVSTWELVSTFCFLVTFSSISAILSHFLVIFSVSASYRIRFLEADGWSPSSHHHMAHTFLIFQPSTDRLFFFLYYSGNTWT